jgi:hypothetical protein
MFEKVKVFILPDFVVLCRNLWNIGKNCIKFETLYKNGDASDGIAIFSACYPAREENLEESLYAAWIKHPNNSGNYGRNFGKRRFRELTASEKQKFYDYLKILNEWLSENYCSVVES